MSWCRSHDIAAAQSARTALATQDFDALFTTGQADHLRPPRLSVADPSPHLPAEESREYHVRGYKEEGTTTHAVGHGRAQRSRPLPPGLGCDRPRAAALRQSRLREAGHSRQVHGAQDLHPRAWRRHALRQGRRWGDLAGTVEVIFPPPCGEGSGRGLEDRSRTHRRKYETSKRPPPHPSPQAGRVGFYFAKKLFSPLACYPVRRRLFRYRGHRTDPARKMRTVWLFP